MGVSASSHRLRKTLAIRAYNVRKNDETIEEQFRQYSYRKEDESGNDIGLYISLAQIKECLQIDAPWFDALFRSIVDTRGCADDSNWQQCDGEMIQELKYADFIEFVESGKIPDLRTSNSSSNTTASSSSRKSGKSASTKRQQLQQHLREAKSLSCDNTPRNPNINSNNNSDNNTESSNIRKLTASSSLPTMSLSPSSPSSSSKEDQSIETPSMTDSESLSSDNVVVSYDVVIPDKLKLGNQLHAGVIRPLWRKREVVRQERTIQYTTIGADGEEQELVEKEISQTEVLHMECRETGEFAHRETTNYEQLETFNSEVVKEQHGTEEYVHLKSIDDEFEYMESTMPKKDTAPDGSDPAAAGYGSPRVAGADGEGYFHQDGNTSQCNMDEHPTEFNYDDLTEEEKLQLEEEMRIWQMQQDILRSNDPMTQAAEAEAEAVHQYEDVGVEVNQIPVDACIADNIVEDDDGDAANTSDMNNLSMGDEHIDDDGSTNIIDDASTADAAAGDIVNEVVIEPHAATDFADID